MRTTDKKICRIISHLLSWYGIKDIVVSPGSRNAPLIIAVSRAKDKSGNDLFNVHCVLDERAAAFFALGIARKTEAPVALICTSGSALLNYAPALSEAYYSNIPLIAISADRPQWRIDTCDQQTIRQPGALSNIVKTWVDIPVDVNSPKMEAYAQRNVCKALAAAVESNPKGPVHINVQLDVPLNEETDDTQFSDSPKSVKVYPTTSVSVPSAFTRINSLTKILIVCGQMHPSPRLVCMLRQLSKDPRICILTEAQSNLEEIRSCSVRTALAEPFLESEIKSGIPIMPDMVFTLGNTFTAAMLQKVITEVRTVHVHVGYTNSYPDMFDCLEEIIPVGYEEFICMLNDYLEMSTSECTPYSELWKTLENRSLQSLQKYVVKDGNEFSLLFAVFEILKRYGADIQFSNGSAIRYAQMFFYGKDQLVDANRGVNGIEGSTSTAIGACSVTPEKITALITGDMSAAYDISALSLIHRKLKFKMFVLDNAGGGIFRSIAPTRFLGELERYFAFAPKMPLEKLAQAYGLRYFEFNSLEQYDRLAELIANDQPVIIDIKLNLVESAYNFRCFTKGILK